MYAYICKGKSLDYLVLADTIISNVKNFLGHFLHGLKLKSYEFKKYKSKKDIKSFSISISGSKNIPSNYDQLKFKALEEGTFYARDLVSEPGNILHPDEYARRIKSLGKIGLKVKIHDEKILKNLECMHYLE